MIKPEVLTRHYWRSELGNHRVQNTLVSAGRWKEGQWRSTQMSILRKKRWERACFINLSVHRSTCEKDKTCRINVNWKTNPRLKLSCFPESFFIIYFAICYLTSGRAFRQLPVILWIRIHISKNVLSISVNIKNSDVRPVSVSPKGIL